MVLHIVAREDLTEKGFCEQRTNTGEKERQLSEGKAFQAEGRASPDAQRHEMFG